MPRAWIADWPTQIDVLPKPREPDGVPECISPAAVRRVHRIRRSTTLRSAF